MHHAHASKNSEILKQILYEHLADDVADNEWDRGRRHRCCTIQDIKIRSGISDNLDIWCDTCGGIIGAYQKVKCERCGEPHVLYILW